MPTMTLDQLAAALVLSGDLEHDLQAHTGYYYEVVRAHAQAENDAETSKFNLAQTEADLQLRLRREVATGGEKITEAGIQARMQLTEEFQKDNLTYLQAKAVVREWSALRDSYEQRGYCMNNLTNLATRGVSSSGITEYQNLRKTHAAARVPIRK